MIEAKLLKIIPFDFVIEFLSNTYYRFKQIIMAALKHINNSINRNNKSAIINKKQRSPGSDDHESPVGGGYRDRGPIPPSMSSHSMKVYCVSSEFIFHFTVCFLV